MSASSGNWLRFMKLAALGGENPIFSPFVFYVLAALGFPAPRGYNVAFIFAHERLCV